MIPDDARVTGREIYEGLYQRWDGTKIGDPKSASLELKERGSTAFNTWTGRAVARAKAITTM